MKHGRAAFAFVFVTVLLDILALGITVPVLPKLIIQFEQGNIADAASATGLFAFVWAAMHFIFSPVIGVLSDHYGRRPVILLSNLGLGLDYILMALAPSLGWLLLGRVISGITASSFPTASAYVADVTPPEERAAKFGMLGASFGVGFSLGPARGGFLGGMDLRYPFWAAASLSLANFVYGFFILPESLPLDKRAPFSFANANPLGSLKLLRSHPQLSGLATAKFLHSNAHEALPVMFVLYTTYRYHWRTTHGHDACADRCRFHACIGGADPQDNSTLRRSSDTLFGNGVRHYRIRSLRRGSKYHDLSGRLPIDILVGIIQPLHSIVDEQARKRFRAGPIAGGVKQSVRHSGHDIAASLHRCFFVGRGPGTRGEVSWRGLLDAGGVTDGDAMDCMECYS